MSAIERFAKEYQSYHRISPVRARQQLALLREFEATLDGRLITGALQSDLQQFAGALMDRRYHVNTVRKKLNMIRPFFSWAYATGLVTADQYLGMKQVRNPRGATGHSKPRPYTRKELDAFWAALDAALPLLPKRGRGSQALNRWLSGRGHWRHLYRHAMRLQIEAMVSLALHGGLRMSEIYSLAMDDLHYDNEYIVVLGKRDPATGHVKKRQVPFTDDMRGAVYRWLEFRALMRPQHSSPWVSCYGPRTYSNPMYFDRFDELLRKVVGEEWAWHRFRHTCATQWLRSGVELEIVSTLLGHATLQQTLAYAKIAEADIARAMAKREADFSEAVNRRAA